MTASERLWRTITLLVRADMTAGIIIAAALLAVVWLH
jgi:hypothetical protein